MLKIVANMSKKVPIVGLEYSSQSFMAGIEVEVSDSATKSEIKQKINDVYRLLENCIDKEIEHAEKFNEEIENTNEEENENKNSGRSTPARTLKMATENQVKAIYAISKSNGLSKNEILNFINGKYKVSNPESLSIAQASDLISGLKNNNNTKEAA